MRGGFEGAEGGVIAECCGFGDPRSWVQWLGGTGWGRRWRWGFVTAFGMAGCDYCERQAGLG